METLAETYPEEYATYSILYDPEFQEIFQQRVLTQDNKYKLRQWLRDETFQWRYAQKHIDDSGGDSWVASEIHAENSNILEEILRYGLPWERTVARVTIFKEELFMKYS